MGSQLTKNHSGLLYEVQFWIAIVKIGAGVLRQLYLDTIKLFL